MLILTRHYTLNCRLQILPLTVYKRKNKLAVAAKALIYIAGAIKFSYSCELFLQLLLTLAVATNKLQGYKLNKVICFAATANILTPKSNISNDC